MEKKPSLALQINRASVVCSMKLAITFIIGFLCGLSLTSYPAHQLRKVHDLRFEVRSLFFNNHETLSKLAKELQKISTSESKIIWTSSYNLKTDISQLWSSGYFTGLFIFSNSAFVLATNSKEKPAERFTLAYSKKILRRGDLLNDTYLITEPLINGWSVVEVID